MSHKEYVISLSQPEPARQLFIFFPFTIQKLHIPFILHRHSENYISHVPYTWHARLRATNEGGTVLLFCIRKQ